MGAWERGSRQAASMFVGSLRGALVEGGGGKLLPTAVATVQRAPVSTLTTSPRPVPRTECADFPHSDATV